MRFSTGVILSMLSANVFAIEHPNGAHPSSLLARRAVVADTDGHSLQKRTNGKDQDNQQEQEKRAPPKAYSFPTNVYKGSAYDNLSFEDNFYSNPNPNSDTGEDPTDSPTYSPDQGDEDNNERENAYTGIDPSQEEASFVNFPRESPAQVLDRIKKELFRVKPRLNLFYARQKATAASKAVKSHFVGKRGDDIGEEVYALLSYALKLSQSFKRLYLDLVNSPFRLKLHLTIPDESKQRCKDLQDGVLQSIGNHILDIKNAIEHITTETQYLINWLEDLMGKTDLFCQSISNMRSRYSSLLEDLGISDDSYIEDLDTHIENVEMYKLRLSDYVSRIERMVKTYIEHPKRPGTSKS
ncbi:hypothetical protein BASA50_008512 [Batrachochytrium salamandrivorans]|uniref:Uncharacterized protein n=1 Tax=Batrachochytrium salamandrivorans TaxID=1357716 RepID=A0ABQ8F6Z2_9FUNG|nr:hypothetical protein BASA50_008512 [Batrachochytrium salamandrivorans]